MAHLLWKRTKTRLLLSLPFQKEKKQYFPLKPLIWNTCQKTLAKSTDTYMVHKSEHSMIKTVINVNTTCKRFSDIKFKCSVLNRINDTIKLTSSQGLKFTGMWTEALYTLYDDSLNHKNFLEIMKLLFKKVFQAILENVSKFVKAVNENLRCLVIDFEQTNLAIIYYKL